MAFNKQKAFGQHFLKDTAIIDRIVDAALIAVIGARSKDPATSLLEIGPGKGAITRPLLERLPIEVPFHLAERDRDLIEYWSGESRVSEFLKGDFLDQTNDAIERLGPLVVVSNLPYSAGTAIVVRLAERSHQISEMVLMFQAEVAKRLYAEPSTPDRGSLSLYIQNEWDVERVCVVPPAAFAPPPKVMSEVVRLRRRAAPRVDLQAPGSREAWNGLLRLAFQHRRKMIKGNFAGTRWQQALEKSGVDPTLRAEGLTWEGWILLWKNRADTA
jgi:16S rRNA (adenine1518-N6/adenine1519-N6)-dimethyltransferase